MDFLFGFFVCSCFKIKNYLYLALQSNGLYTY